MQLSLMALYSSTQAGNSPGFVHNRSGREVKKQEAVEAAWQARWHASYTHMCIHFFVQNKRMPSKN